MMTADINAQVVERFWGHFFARDWKNVARAFTEDAHYTDAGVDPVGARGRAEIIARLMPALSVPTRYDHRAGHMIAQGKMVVTEHVELWGFASGEAFEHPFCSVMEVQDGLIARWWDYGHAAAIFRQAPADWVDRARKWRDHIRPLSQLWPDEGFA